MKKNNLLKVLGISFLIIVLLSWFIKTGTITSGTYTNTGTNPIGIYNLFRIPVITIQTFVQYLICFTAIGGFYGVLNKLGCYDKVIKNITNKFKKKPTVFIVISILFFTLLSSFTGETLVLFAFIPFFATILSMLGYNNLLACLVTIGSILVGQIGSIYGFTIVGYYKNVLSVGMNNGLLIKGILFILTTGLFIITILKNIKKNKYKQEETDEILLYEKNEKKKSSLPFIIITILGILFSLIACYNWYYSFNIEIFNKINEFLTNIKIGNYPIMSNILNGMPIIGFLGNYEFIIVLFIMSAILAWIYNVSIDEYVDGIKKGCMQMLIPAIYATLANIIFTYMLTSENGTIYETIINGITNLSTNFNAITTMLISFIGSLLYNDYYYVINSASVIFTNFEEAYRVIAGILSGAIYSLVMLVAPVSLYLVAGLKYFNVSYKDWIKQIWKYALLSLLIVIVITTIAYALI